MCAAPSKSPWFYCIWLSREYSLARDFLPFLSMLKEIEWKMFRKTSRRFRFQATNLRHHAGIGARKGEKEGSSADREIKIRYGIHYSTFVLERTSTKIMPAAVFKPEVLNVAFSRDIRISWLDSIVNWLCCIRTNSRTRQIKEQDNLKNFRVSVKIPNFTKRKEKQRRGTRLKSDLTCIWNRRVRHL